MSRLTLYKVFAFGFLFSAAFNSFLLGKTLRGASHFALALVTLFVVVLSDTTFKSKTRPAALLMIGITFFITLMFCVRVMFVSL
jgi:hypothetical protein